MTHPRYEDRVEFIRYSTKVNGPRPDDLMLLLFGIVLMLAIGAGVFVLATTGVLA